VRARMGTDRFSTEALRLRSKRYEELQTARSGPAMQSDRPSDVCDIAVDIGGNAELVQQTKKAAFARDRGLASHTRALTRPLGLELHRESMTMGAKAA
jgi:hypothetical protein